MTQRAAMDTAAIAAVLDPSNDKARWAIEHLARDVVAWVTTVAPDGMPQSSVVSFQWDGQSVLFYSMPDTAKLRNIERNPRVAFNLQSDAYGDHACSFEGLAEIDTTADPWAASGGYSETYLSKYIEPLAHWGMDPVKTASDFSVAVRIRPTRIRCW